jgi:hypothetical protein
VSAPPALPLFFKEVVALDADRHKRLRLDRGKDYGFARRTNAIPLALPELAAAAADYPIVFGGPGQQTALAIVGYRDAENLFVEPDGAWRAGCYVPAYVRNYPFAFIEAPGGASLILGIDPGASCLGASGSLLFAETQAAAALTEAIELAKSLHHSLKAAAALCAALEKEGLLIENRAIIEFTRGGSAVLAGFRVVDAAKFAKLSDRKFLDWRRRDWLAPVYAHLQSTGRWARIVDLAATQPTV